MLNVLRDELNLELSQSKTLITHARTGAARFLGYEITVQHADHKVTGKRRCPVYLYLVRSRGSDLPH